MKNIGIYYLTISIPLLLLVFGTRLHFLPANGFVVGILLYAIVYHPWITALRLYNLQKIGRKDIIKNFIPFWNFRYFKVIFMGLELPNSGTDKKL